jgi:hypothetical protein
MQLKGYITEAGLLNGVESNTIKCDQIHNKDFYEFDHTEPAAERWLWFNKLASNGHNEP